MVKVVTLTVNPTIDKSTTVDSVASEIKIRCATPTFDPGGGGINVSRAIKKLGSDSTAIYTSGGGMGELLTTLLKSEQVDTLPIPIDGMTRENLTVYETSSGLQYRFGMPGPTLSTTECERLLDAIFAEDADYVVASGSLAPGMPDDFYRQLADRAQNKKTRVIVDTSGKALEACADAHVFLLKPNLRELEILSGKGFHSEEQLRDIAQGLIREGMAEVFIISMGASGALFISAEDMVKMRPPVVPVQSKVGAGDSMVGGVVWALANGESLFDAVRYGIAAGSAAVMTPGTELCRAEDVHNIVERVAIID